MPRRRGRGARRPRSACTTQCPNQVGHKRGPDLAKLWADVTVTDIRSRREQGASALDQDTALLSGLLEETIADQGGEALRNAVVRLHLAAARARAGEPEAEED